MVFWLWIALIAVVPPMVGLASLFLVVKMLDLMYPDLLDSMSPKTPH